MTRGYRPIVVGPHRLRWRFAPGAVDSVVTVVGPPGASSRLIVTLRGWRDPWMALSGFTIAGDQITLHHGVVNDPLIVSPAFVRAAVDHAFARGWEPQHRGSTLRLEHTAGAFQTT